MRAVAFEVRHQTLLHLFVGLALLAYAVNPDDIVWAIVRGHSNNRTLERLVFGAGAMVVAGSAVLEMWVTARHSGVEASNLASALQRPRWPLNNTPRLARLLFAFGLGLLLPLPGTVLLIGGEMALILRLLLHQQENELRTESSQSRYTPLDAVARVALVQRGAKRPWRLGFRVSASRRGVAVSLILLAVTLQDRIAEVSAGIGFLVWLMVNGHRSFASGAQD